MKIIHSYTLLLTIMVTLSGCGLIYTHKTVPLDMDHSQTPACVTENGGRLKHGEKNIKHIKYQYYLDIRLFSNAIGDIAEQEGIETLYYADLETFSILGIWNQYTVHVYGK